MKKILMLFVLMIGLNHLHAQSDKNLVYDVNAEKRNIKDFNGVEVSGAIDLYLSQGKEEAVAVSAGSVEATAKIKTELKNGILHIYFDSKGWGWKNWNNNKMKAYVTFVNLKKIEASGACNVRIVEKVHADELKIQLSGASDFKGEIKAGNLKLGASGASGFKVSGISDKLDIDVSGASYVKGYDLKTEDAILDASGASTIQIAVVKSLVASASGGSSIHYKGNCQIKDINSSGGASIKRKTED